MKTLKCLFAAVAVGLAAFSSLGANRASVAAVVSMRPDRATCTYSLNEPAKLQVRVCGTNGAALASGRLTVRIDNFGAKSLQPDRTVDLARENPFQLTVTRGTPGFVRVTVASPDPALVVKGNAGQGGGYVYGVAFAPDRIAPGTPEPADFDAFWADAMRKLDATVPEDARLEPMPESSNEQVLRYRVSFATANGRRVYGWLSEPKDLSKGPFPVRISVPGAGIGATGPGGDAHAVCLTMNVHSYPQPEGKGPAADAARRRAYVDQDARYAKPCGVARYCQSGVHKSREDYFYYPSILGINRAVNWLARRPACDLTRFTYSGTSQGGGFGLFLTGLNRHITRSCIFVPAITDLLSSNVEERQSGWPRILEAQKPENRAAAARNAPYFCGVNFARRITCPVRFVVGFSDNVCAPHAVYAAYNVCPSSDKRIFDGLGMGHGVFGDFYNRLAAWQMQAARR